MFEFNKLCKAVEQMDPVTYGAVITEKSVNIIAALTAITQSGKDGLTIYLHFILCSIAADGKLDEHEFALLQKSLEASIGHEITYEEAKQIFSDAGLDKPAAYKEAVDLMVDILGLVSVELKTDIILVCLMICAVDGHVSHKEKKWIKQLIR